MHDSFLKKIIAISLSVSLVNGDILGSIGNIGGSVGGLGGSISSIFSGAGIGALSGAFSIPGLSESKVECNNLFDLNALAQIDSMCGALNRIGNAGSFGFGPCAIGGTVGDCAKRSARDFCSNMRNKIVKTTAEGEAILLDPVNSAGISAKSSILTGGDIIMAAPREACANKTSAPYDGVSYGGTKESDVYRATTMRNSPGLSAFDRGIETARDCIRAATMAGKSLSSVKSKCLNGLGVALPANKTVADQSVADTATKLLASPDNGLASSMMATEASIAKKLANCSSSSDYDSCKRSQLSSSQATDTTKMKDSSVTDTELVNARKLEIMEKATQGKRLFVHFDDQSISDLPIQSRAEYASGMRRQIDFTSSYRYIASESSSISKDVSKIAMKKMEESARPFMENKSLQGISSVLNQ